MSQSKIHLSILIALGIASVGLSVVSVFFQSWRVGGSSKLLYPNTTDSVVTTKGFDSRYYGLVNVVGVRSQSWGVLSSNACDRWQLYNATNSLFDTAPVCESAIDTAACSTKFSTHLESRCKVYGRITVITWITMAAICLSQLLNIFVVISLLLTSFATWKHYLAAAMCLAAFFTSAVTVGWILLTRLWFKTLAESGTYPYPTVGLAGYLAIASAGVLIFTAVYITALSFTVSRDDPDFKKRGLLEDLLKRGVSTSNSEEPSGQEGADQDKPGMFSGLFGKSEADGAQQPAESQGLFNQPAEPMQGIRKSASKASV